MKKVITAIAIGMVCLGGLTLSTQRAEALSYGTITVTVTCQYLEIVITPGAYTYPGVVELGTESVSTGSNTITNNSNIPVTLSIRGTNTANWTIDDTTIGTNQFRLGCLFSVSQPVTGSFTVTQDFLNTTSKKSTTAIFSYAGNPSANDGVDVPASGGQVYLWFRFDAPNVNDFGAAQNIVVTVTASP